MYDIKPCSNTKAAFTFYSISGGLIAKNGAVTPLYEAFPGLKDECHALAEVLIDDTRYRPPVALSAAVEEMIWGLFRAWEFLSKTCDTTDISDRHWYWRQALDFLNAYPARVQGLAFLERHPMGRIDGLPMTRFQGPYQAPDWEAAAIQQISRPGPWADGFAQLKDLAVLNRTAVHLSERLYNLGGQRLESGRRLRGGGLLESLCGVGYHEGDYVMAYEFLTDALERLMTASHPANGLDKLMGCPPSQEEFLNLGPRDEAGNPLPWKTCLAEEFGRKVKSVELMPEPELVEWEIG